jgi:carbon storage regulator CsrA
MLVLGRNLDQSIILFTNDGPIEIKILNSSHRGIRVGIKAPETVKILRKELLSKGNKNTDD